MNFFERGMVNGSCEYEPVCDQILECIVDRHCRDDSDNTNANNTHLWLRSDMGRIVKGAVGIMLQSSTDGKLTLNDDHRCKILFWALRTMLESPVQMLLDEQTFRDLDLCDLEVDLNVAFQYLEKYPHITVLAEMMQPLMADMEEDI